MTTVGERHLRCAFDGGRTGVGPATWGQRAIWDAVRALAPEDAARYTVRGGGAVEPGFTVARIVEAVGVLMLRHESLRTRLAPDADGALRQTLLGAGDLSVTVVGCGLDEVEGQASALADQIAAEPFDAAAEWPIRVGVVESGGFARYLVLAVAHTAVDGWGLRHLVLDLAELTVHGAAHATPASLQPLEQAEFQASPRGLRQDAKARAYWLAKAEQGPRQLLPARAVAPGTPFPNALLDSPALGRAVPLLAGRLAVSPAAVLLAAAAATVGELGGSAEVLFQVVVNNRFQPGLGPAVSTLAQEGLFHLTVTDAPFSDLVRAAFGASMATYRHAYYDKTRLDGEIAALRSAATGIADLTCFVNDTRGLLADPAAPEAEPEPEAGAPESLAGMRARTTLRWPVEFPPRPRVSFALDAVDLPGSLGLTMTADPGRLPRPEMERLLYGIEDRIVEQAVRLPVAAH